MSKKFETYEQVSQYLLDRFAADLGLDKVEGKQEIKGQQSGTTWEIDAKGIRIGNDGFVIVECRRYTTSSLKQEHLAAIAYRITDTGAKGGIVVSPLALQEGAKKIAEAEGIVEVKLNPDATKHEYVLKFLNKVMIGVRDVLSIQQSIAVRIERKDDGTSEELKLL